MYLFTLQGQYSDFQWYCGISANKEKAWLPGLLRLTADLFSRGSKCLFPIEVGLSPGYRRLLGNPKYFCCVMLTRKLAISSAILVGQGELETPRSSTFCKICRQRPLPTDCFSVKVVETEYSTIHL